MDIKQCYLSQSLMLVHGIFSPVADLVRDPRWGRVMETTGEDAYLNSLYAKAAVEGFQGDLSLDYVASCLKHFAAYGAPEAGREYNTVDMSERKLRQDYLPAYNLVVYNSFFLINPKKVQVLKPYLILLKESTILTELYPILMESTST